MTTVVPATATFRPGRALSWLGGVIGGGVAISAVYATTGLGSPCPFRMMTGWNCPFCGGTRMGAALLHLDVAGAFWFNPLAFVALALVTLLGLAWFVEFVGGPAVRPPAALRARLQQLRPWHWLVVGAVVLVAWTLARNLL